MSDYLEKLQQLKSIFEGGFITEEQYESEKQKIFNELGLNIPRDSTTSVADTETPTAEKVQEKAQEDNHQELAGYEIPVNTDNINMLDAFITKTYPKWQNHASS